MIDYSGHVWSDLCDRLPEIVRHGKARETIRNLPLVDASPSSIPDDALWAAVLSLGMLASTYRYEEENDGRDDARNNNSGNVIAQGNVAECEAEMITIDEEPETKVRPSLVYLTSTGPSREFGNSLQNNLLKTFSPPSTFDSIRLVTEQLQNSGFSDHRTISGTNGEYGTSMDGIR